MRRSVRLAAGRRPPHPAGGAVLELHEEQARKKLEAVFEAMPAEDAAPRYEPVSGAAREKRE